MNEFLSISLSTGIIILVLLLLTPIICKRYTAKWRVLLWLMVAIRLLVPMNVPLPQSGAINIPMPSEPMVISQEQVALQVEAEVPATAMITRTVDVGRVLLFVWLAGVLAFLLYHAMMYFLFARSVRRWRTPFDSPVFDEVKSEMGIRRRIRLYRSESVSSPIMVGLIRPCVVLPMEDFGDDLRVVLWHELTHYRRGDLWYKLVLLLVNAVHWFNPMVYALCYQANSDLEIACDDEVVRDRDIDYRKSYSHAIMNALKNQLNVAVSTNFKGGKGAMKARLNNILDTKARKRGVIFFAILFAMISTASLVVIGGQSGMFGGILGVEEEILPTPTPVPSVDAAVEEGTEEALETEEEKEVEKKASGPARLRASEVSVNGISSYKMTPEQIVAKYGQPREILDNSGLAHMTYTYSGISFTFTEVYKDEAMTGEQGLSTVQVTGKQKQTPRDIQVGDSFQSVLNKLPQEKGNFSIKDNGFHELYGTSVNGGTNFGFVSYNEGGYYKCITLASDDSWKFIKIEFENDVVVSFSAYFAGAL